MRPPTATLMMKVKGAVLLVAVDALDDGDWRIRRYL
jgi:hypothetical protein